jgi:hypothetical protein
VPEVSVIRIMGEYGRRLAVYELQPTLGSLAAVGSG